MPMDIGAIYGQSDKGKGKGKSKAKSKGKMVECFNCGKWGHSQKDCWAPRKGTGKGGGKSKGNDEKDKS
eukprot:3850504-Heterocapsa_arctica.AAC.1